MKTVHLKKTRHSPARRTRRAALTTVKPVAADKLQIKRILIPTDFSPMSLKALRYGVRFAEQYGATIQLLYVIEPPGIRVDSETLPLVVPVVEDREDCMKELLSLAKKHIEEQAPVKVEVRVGCPAAEICEAARESEADLIIMSTHGRTGLDWMLVGSTAEKVVRHALCPVLIVREREHEFVCP